ncbi:MAG: type IV pilin protein [Gallionella sp.]
MKYAKGFTLIELMIVVAVIAVLASIALPAYGDYVKRSKLVDATTQLSDGRVKIEQYFQDNRTYADAGANISPCPATTKYFTITCGDLTTATYTLTATGKNDLSAFSYTINQNNIKTSNTPWGNGASCWVMRKGDAC